MTAQKIEDIRCSKIRHRGKMWVGRASVGLDERADESVRCLIQKIQEDPVGLKVQNEMLSTNRHHREEAKQKYENLFHKYASLFEFAPIGYLVVDRDGVIHEINLAAAITLNAPRKALSGRCITEFIHWDDQDSFYYHKLNCHENLETATFELKMRKADGFFFDAQMQMQPIFPPHGIEPQYSIALSDISEHVQLSSSYALEQRCLELACTATDIQSLLDAYVQQVKSYLRCDAVGIRIRDVAGNILYQAYDGFSPEIYKFESPLSLYTDQCMATEATKRPDDPDWPFYTDKGSFYLNGNIRFPATVSSAGLGAIRNTCFVHGYESLALIPITIGNAIEGLIHVADRRENKFPLRLVETLETVSARLGLSIQRFYLQQQLRESVASLNDLSSHLLTAQEDEQQRIAIELHDGCGQDLNVLKLRLTNLKQRLPDDATDLINLCSDLLTSSDRIINDIRNIAHGLKPSALDVLGFTAAAGQMFCEFSTFAKLMVEADIDELDQIADPTTQICLYRIFQEALSNIYKHAHATRIRVTAQREGRILRICIKDNGIGFSNDHQLDRTHATKGMGLSALALRCRMIGAELTIDSERGKGTRLTISLPCPHPKARP